jgi:hypothetical protein
LFLILPELKKLIENDSDDDNVRSYGFGFGQTGFGFSQSGLGFCQTGFGFGQTDVGFGQTSNHLYDGDHLKSLVDLIEVEYEFRVCEIKEMIDYVSSHSKLTLFCTVYEIYNPQIIYFRMLSHLKIYSICSQMVNI